MSLKVQQLTPPINLRLEVRAMKEIQRIAQEQERSVAEVVRIALRDWLKRQEEKRR